MQWISCTAPTPEHGERLTVRRDMNLPGFRLLRPLLTFDSGRRTRVELSVNGRWRVHPLGHFFICNSLKKKERQFWFVAGWSHTYLQSLVHHVRVSHKFSSKSSSLIELQYRMNILSVINNDFVVRNPIKNLWNEVCCTVNYAYTEASKYFPLHKGDGSKHLVRCPSK